MLQDRVQAASLLALRLEPLKGKHPLVLALPRGGVPMGRVIAEALDGDLDVLLVAKLGAPQNPEVAIGAVDETAHVTLLAPTPGMDLPGEYVHEEAARQLHVLRDRRERYTAWRRSLDPEDRYVIVVDDGVATGATVRAALRLLRARKPREITVAVGVMPRDTLEELLPEADRVVCLEMPVIFHAVGSAYEDFTPVGDEEVVRHLREFAARP